MSQTATGDDDLEPFHYWKTVNGIDVKFWSESHDRAREHTRRFVAALPRGGHLDDGVDVTRVDGMVNRKDEVTLWVRSGEFHNVKAPEGWTIKSVSVFGARHDGETANAAIEFAPEEY